MWWLARWLACALAGSRFGYLAIWLAAYLAIWLAGYLANDWLADYCWLDVWLTGGLIGGVGRLVIWGTGGLDLAGYLVGCLHGYLVGWQAVWLAI